MALDKTALAASLKAALDAAASANPTTGNATRLALANDMADAVDTFVKAADVTVAVTDGGLQTAPPGGGVTTPPPAPATITGGLS